VYAEDIKYVTIPTRKG